MEDLCRLAWVGIAKLLVEVWDKKAKGLKVGSECLERSLGKPFISHPIREQWVGNKAQILTENLKGMFQHE